MKTQTQIRDRDFESAILYVHSAYDKKQLSLGQAVVAAAKYHKVDAQALARHMLDYIYVQKHNAGERELP